MVKEKINKKKPIISKQRITKYKKENTKICKICYIEKNNKFVNCTECENNYCQKCWIKNYKLCSRINGDCLNYDCNFLLDRRFIFNNFNKSFYNYWKKNEINKIISFEKILVEQERRRRDNNSEKNKLLQFKCPDESCNGLFYKDNYNCTICKKLICHKCHKFNDDNHTCESNDIKNINEVLKNITQCPSCKEIIHKIEGCNDMFCTICNTYFNFKTRKETGYRHNPHIGNIDSINNQNEIDFLENHINQNINNELKKKLNNFDFVNNQLITNYKGQNIINSSNDQNIITSSNDQNITSSSSNYQNVIHPIDLSGLRNQQQTLLNHSTNGSNQNTTSSNSINQNTTSSNNSNNQNTTSSGISINRNIIYQNLLNLLNSNLNTTSSSSINQNRTSSNNPNNQNRTSSNNPNNQNAMSLINNPISSSSINQNTTSSNRQVRHRQVARRPQVRQVLLSRMSLINNQNTTSSTSSINQNTTSSNNLNLNNQNAMSLINNQNTTSTSSINQNTTSSNNLNNQNAMSLINNQQINRHNNTSLINTIFLDGMNLFNNQQNNGGNNILLTHLDNVLRLNDENRNDLNEFNNNQDIYIFEKRYIYYKSNNKILVIDLELNIFKKVYELKDLESFSLLYVNNDKIILKNKDNLYFINNNNEDKLIVKSNSFLLKEDNLSPICIKLLIDLNKETGKIIYLSIENSIVEYNLNESKIYNKWDLPTEYLDNCEDIIFIENRELFIFNMKNNLQIFKIQPDSKLVFKTVIISNNDKIIKSNFVNTKYIIGVNKNIGYYFKTEHNIIDLDKLEVVKKIEYRDTFDSSNLNDIYFENENIYYFYSKNFLKKIKFYKVDIKKEIESINNCTESIDILESSGINRINFRNVYRFIPELKILMTIPFPKKNFFALPYICKFNKISESIKNIQILEKNLKKILRIMNIYGLNTNDIHVFTSNIRTKYLNNSIDEKRFEKNIKRKINEFQKKKDINNIFNSMKGEFKSILEKYKNRYLENNEDFKKEFQNLQKIVNKDFETNSKIFSCTKFVLNLFSENLDNVLRNN